MHPHAPLRIRQTAPAIRGVMRAVAIVALACVAAHHAAASSMPFPPGAIVVDVTQPPFNADPTGTTDSTAAIQLAINRASFDGVAGDGIADDGTDDGWQDGLSASRPRIIYFPAGVYRISDTLAGPALNDLKAGGCIMLQGESRTGTILRLIPNAPGFNNPSSPKPVFTNFRGNTTNNAFMNSVENLTIEVGAGNPGAIGLQFLNNNTGHVRGVTIRSLDPSLAGVAGLHLCPGSDPNNPTGIGLIQDVLIEGFGIGIDTSRGFQMPWVLDRVTLSGQTNVGILNANRPLSICSLTSNNTVPALRQTGAAGQVVMVNSSLTGGAANQPAIDLQAGYGFFRNIARSGYVTTLRITGVNQPDNLTNDERVVGPVLKLWDTTPSRSLNLPIVDAPAIPWDAAADWAVVPAPTNNEITDTAAIQAALNSGKPAIILQPGIYAINNTLLIGPNVRRIHGNWATLRLHSSFRIQDVPVFRFSSSNHPAVVIEKLQGLWADSTAYLVHHQSASDLILRDLFWVAGPVYRNTPGTGGRLFIENVHSLGGSQIPRENRPAFIFDHQQVWARQINPEMQHPHIINDGGQLVILGFKTGEQRGPSVLTRNGGYTEILGGVQNNTHDDPPSDPANTTILQVENANLSAILSERFESLATAWGNNAYVARETRGTETRTLRPPVVYRDSGNTTYSTPVPGRPGQLGVVIPLFVGYQNGSAISALVPRVREGSGPTAAFTVTRDSADVSQPLTINYTVSGSAVPGVDYQPLPGSITIPAGQSSASIPVTPIDVEGVSAPRSLIVALSPSPAYALGTVTSASIEIVSESLVNPDAVALEMASNATSSANITVFNPDSSPITYTLSGLNPVYTVEHRNTESGDYIQLPPSRVELFPVKPQDDNQVTVSLPFAFPFYGTSYSQVRVTTNGYVTFNVNSTALFANVAVPSTSAPRAMIAYYWDDLYFDSLTKCWHASVDLNSDSVADAWVLEIQDATTYETRNNAIPERISAQLWLFRDGAIRIVFLQSTIQAVSYTIGIQNWEQTQGINLVYNGSEPSRVPAGPLPPAYRAQAGTTVLFTPPVSWVSISTGSLTVPAGGQASFSLTFNSTNLPVGSQRTASLLLSSSTLSHTLPVSLEIIAGPPTPGGFSATAISHTQINLSWNDVSGETGYRIERSPDGVSNWSLLAEPAANTTSFADTGLSPQTTWFYRIRAFNAAGNSSWSAAVQATTQPPPSPPLAASNLTATNASGSAIQLAWNDNSNNETGFRIERSSDGGATFTTLTTLPAGSTAYLDFGLPAATAFTYRVIATNAIGDAPPSNLATATTPAISTVITATTAEWLRGNTGSTPPSTATLNGTDLTLFAGGTNNATDTQTPVWCHFPAVTLADGETIRLRASVRINGSTPSVGQGFSLGLVNTNGTKLLTNAATNNPPDRRDDAGYGFTFGLGGHTTTRYIYKPAANNANGPWGAIDNSTNTLVLGSTPATTTLQAETTLEFALELTRMASSLSVRAFLNGALYDGGRTAASPETFTYDSVAIVLRRQTLNVTLGNLTVERLVNLTPLQSWRLTHFGSTAGTGSGADTADPDADGVANLIEYALGGDPNSPASRPQTGAGVAEVSGQQRLTLTFTPQVTTGLTYTIEASSDLATWSTVANPTASLTPGQPYTYTDSADLAATPRRFLRLRVSQ